MSDLRNILESSGFKIGVELVSTRGTTHQEKAIKLRSFGKDLCNNKSVDWISITENAGGHPAISPSTIGRPILEKGKPVIVHMTCKDNNRNSLESKAWELSSDGFFNILSLTGDYPVTGIQGMPKPVFDVDSIGLLYLLKQMNTGLDLNKKKKTHLNKTDFFLGAVVSNYKKNENELIPQYLKLLKKIDLGASFIINQVGYDVGKMSELINFMTYKNLAHIHLIGNVFVLSKFTTKLFNKNIIPGVVLTKELFNYIHTKIDNADDKGKSFFLELAAKQLAIFKGLGYKGGYLGGVHKIEDFDKIMALYNSFEENDWKKFVHEFNFPQNEEFFFFKRDPETLLSIKGQLNPKFYEELKNKNNINLNYYISKHFHRFMFTEGKGFFNIGKKLCSSSKNKDKIPYLLYKAEIIGKHLLFDCHDCGDCSLHEISYLCPESQCAKNQRNGPCGGTYNSKCEVKDITCIWTRAYDRQKHEGSHLELLQHVPTLQNHNLENSSSWSNFWLGKDHCKINE